ncbi:MAG: response regulator [Verrucomicrobiota bacterium]
MKVEMVEGKAVPILLADDEPDCAALIQDTIRETDLPHLLHRVENGEEAIAYLSGEGPYSDRERFPFPYLLLLDLKMPGMGGFGVLRWLGRNPEVRSNLNLVILSSVQSAKEIEVVYELGAQFFCPKSDCEMLQEEMRRLSESWSLRTG